MRRNRMKVDNNNIALPKNNSAAVLNEYLPLKIVGYQCIYSQSEQK
jgi:hypothetical protein